MVCWNPNQGPFLQPRSLFCPFLMPITNILLNKGHGELGTAMVNMYQCQKKRKLNAVQYEEGLFSGFKVNIENTSIL